MADETSAGGVGAIAARGLLGLIVPLRLDFSLFVWALGFLGLAWLSTCFYKVQAGEQGVVLRFGKWVDTSEAGLHLHLPYPIETVLFPRVSEIKSLQIGASSRDPAMVGRERQMLTGDENIVEAEGVVTWRIRDAGRYLFQVSDPEIALRTAAEGALRDVVSRTPIQAAMSDKRREIADETRALLQSMVDADKSGIEVVQVQLQRIEPPAAVIDAFNDVQRARADQERARNEAEAYANDILPRARGQAEHVKQDANGYHDQVINLARGDAEAFLAVYGSYAGAREVTAWRLYLESVDDVLRRSAKVIIDTSGKGMSGIVPYLPINDIRPPAAPQGQIAPTAPGVAPAAPLGGPTPPVLLNGGPTR